MIADKLASFDVVIVHNRYRQGEEQLCDVCHLNDHYKNVNAALAQLCLERGFTILDSLVDSWPGFLSRDGVHPSRLGNKGLADFLHREACALSTHLERRHIQQSYKESKASAWSGWARQEHFSINLEVDFPALGMHAVQYSPAVGGPSAAPAPVWKTSSALMQRHDTDQLANTIHGIGFTLVGGVRVRCKGSKAWWTWDSLPSPIFHGTSVPCKGNTGERPIQPMIPSRGASSTCDRKIRRASQEHESALVRSSVGEEEASAGKAAVPQAVGQRGDSEWKLVQSKKSRRKAAALHKQEQSSKLCADSEGKQKRLLNHGEKEEFFDLAKCNIGAKDFKNLVEQKTGKKLTTKDINNYKQRFSIPIRNEQAHGEMVLEKLETLLKNNSNWVIHYEMNQNNNLQFILLQTTHMREILEKYPEILFIDGTYKVNIEGYILYSILVQDGRGRGRPVCYAFLRNETTEIVEPMFTKFVDFNPFVVSACKVVMIDKDLNELHILTSILPNSNILLCTWHVLHCFQQKVNEKARQQRDQLLPLLKSLVYSPTEQDYFDKLANLQAMTCTDFISYYMHNWHLCEEMWVHAYRQALPTFGNNTNNRIECHNQKIKNYLSSSMHLVQAIVALVGYIDNDSLSLQFSKLKEMKLNLNINDFNDSFQLELSCNCTYEATSKVLEQYEKFKNVSYQVTSTPNSYVVVSPRSQYSVSLCLASCTCAFYNQYTLPCAHILAVRDFTKRDLFDKACIPDRWCKDHFLSDSCTTTSATLVVTSSIQSPPCVKLDTAQEKYTYAYRSLCEMSKTVANVLSNCGEKELMEKLSSCEAFFRNLTTFPRNQTSAAIKAAPAQLAQTTATSYLGHSNSTKLVVPLVKARRGRPKKVRAVKRKFFPNQVKKVGLATVLFQMQI
nr:uncharacterized protein LOC119169923 [Rhipicephalus microplus]